MTRSVLLMIGLAAVGLIVFGLAAEYVEAADAAMQPSPEASDGERPWLLRIGAIVLTAGVLGLFIRRGWWRLPGSTVPRWLMRQPEVGFGLFAAMLLVPMLTVGGFLGVVGPGDDAESPLRFRTIATGLGAAGHVLVLIGLAVIWRRLGRPTWSGREAMSRGRAAVVGVVAVVGVYPVLHIVSELSIFAHRLIVGETPDAIAHETLALLATGDMTGWWLAMVGLVIIAAPLFEEIMYRGGLQSAIRGFGLPGWPAVLLTSAIFTLMHLHVADVHALPTLFTLSVAMGWMYERTGRLTAPIVMHIAFNAANVALALTIPEEQAVAAMVW